MFMIHSNNVVFSHEYFSIHACSIIDVDILLLYAYSHDLFKSSSLHKSSKIYFIYDFIHKVSICSMLKTISNLPGLIMAGSNNLG